jgi:hypothetical protein
MVPVTCHEFAVYAFTRLRPIPRLAPVFLSEACHLSRFGYDDNDAPTTRALLLDMLLELLEDVLGILKPKRR